MSIVILTHPFFGNYGGSPRLGTRVRRHSSRAYARAVADAIEAGRNNSKEMENVAQHLSQFDMDKLVLQWQALLEQVQISPEHE